MAKKELFTQGWEFQLVPVGEAVVEEQGFVPVDIPHDWQIYDSTNLYQDGDGWYQKKFHIKKEEELLYYLYFEGVYMDSRVFVNGEFWGEWKYGYSSFYFDITNGLVDGENIIHVRTRLQHPNSRWYSGAGIYRNVWLKIMPKVHILQDGIYISCKKSDKDQKEENSIWKVDIETEINFSGGNPEEYMLEIELINREGKIEAKKEVSCGKYKKISKKKLSLLPVNEAGAVSCHANLTLENPKLWNSWDIGQPEYYDCHISLFYQNNKIEEETTTFGCRTCEFLPEEGFFLNGRHIKLKGVCEHHDLGALGATFHPAAAKRKLEILKSMGVNAIRTSHNMPAPDLLSLADQMGFLVVDEAFDMWERSKTKYDYARFFQVWAKYDVASWIRRDKNHPCVIMWSVGNEIYDTHADKEGIRIIKKLIEQVLLHDKKQNAKPTIASNYMAGENAQACADIIKIAGYNYAERLYQEHHKLHKDWVIYGSETSSTVQSRGIYHFPLNQPLLKAEDEQCSSLGNSTVGWGAKSTDYCIAMERDHSFSMGQFLWSGFDYIGEPTPYQTKNSYFGQIDTAGFPKDSYYRYRAAWTDYKKQPMVHIFPYWDFNEGQVIDVQVVSNAPLVELFVNGVSQGKQEIDWEKGEHFSGIWQIPYREGSLLAVAYNKEGQEIARKEEHSFGDAAILEIEADKTTIGPEELVFLTIETRDKEGYLVKNANNRVIVKVEGAGRLIGLDNGDSTDYDSYKGVSRRLFSGKLLAIIAPKGQSGKVHVTVTSEGLIPAECILSVVGQPIIEKIEENKQLEIPVEIPIRKIEICTPEGQQMDAAQKEVLVKAIIKPQNATYRDIEWRIADNTGATAINAEIEYRNQEKTEIKVIAKKNGIFCLQAMCKNGTEKTRLISRQEFFVTGLEEIKKNLQRKAWETYNAANCDEVYGDSFLREDNAITHIGNNVSLVFQQIDFGKTGCAAIGICGRTLLEKNSIHIHFSNGKEEKRQIVEFQCCKEYQNQVFPLKNITGVQDITFIFLPGSSFDFKEFQFIKIEKE